MKSFTTADLNKQVGAVTDAARKEPVIITHHRRPKFVLMSIEAFDELHRERGDLRRSFTLEAMPEDVRNGLLALADSYEEDRDGE
ncbi:type II toxin-antitoxin system Phd/YefM family antitoxin [Labrys wisconsinensis]|uniref:Antitoxin n=1 Tax=Labrys wisconsinensis TaxID=425677 RepID=A0ABU0JHK5_9HYPH|nr:type II toxin-antitoxin system Phd/YefM family antitoxin [Labrys wisconsinensis]MDQ0473766.1 prevent-host-death family protein [Labrys wisconsinensis]